MAIVKLFKESAYIVYFTTVCAVSLLRDLRVRYTRSTIASVSMRVKSKPRQWNNPLLRRSDRDEDYDEMIDVKPVPDQQMADAPGLQDNLGAIPAAAALSGVTNADVDAAFILTYKERRSGKSAGQRDPTYQHKATGRKVRSVPEAKRYLAKLAEEGAEGDVDEVAAPQRRGTTRLRKVPQPAEAPWFSMCFSSSSSE